MPVKKEHPSPGSLRMSTPSFATARGGNTRATSFTSYSNDSIKVDVKEEDKKDEKKDEKMDAKEDVKMDEPPHDAFHLDRYLIAQDQDRIFDRVLLAIRKGYQKPQPSTAWLWCMFPQLDHCGTASRRPDRPDVWPRGRALAGLDEARAVLRHPALGPRVRAAARALVASPHADRFVVVDHRFLDVARLHSSLTVLRQAARFPVCIHRRARRVGADVVFRRALERYFPVELDSDDEDGYNSADEDRPPARRFTRHRPTLRRLDALEKEAALRRLASAAAVCCCGEDKAWTDASDRRTLQKVARKTAERTVKNLKKVDRTEAPAPEESESSGTEDSEDSEDSDDSEDSEESAQESDDSDDSEGGEESDQSEQSEQSKDSKECEKFEKMEVTVEEDEDSEYKESEDETEETEEEMEEELLE